ncbi:uncharacterized protein LOC135104523 [Scylla paramamosain]|uniref:uncharacterized protein LOC135104523 n=1 Tax=Scylla paramamosain TaxID=85552 RepID=UPI003082A6EC
MSVTDSGRRPPHLPQQTDRNVTDVQVTPGQHRWSSIWKEARVVPAHKKNSESEPRNYRPISLFSVVGKLLEQVVAGVICHHLGEHHLLSDKQFGFRPGRSTADLLILLSQGWQDALDEGLDTLVGSVLGPILWNINIDDLLRQIPTLLAYADDCSLSRSYCRSDSQ